MQWTFVLKNDCNGKHNSWWLKISNIKDLITYYAITQPKIYSNVLDNYMRGKEFNNLRPSRRQEMSHMPHFKEADLTMAVVQYASNNSLSIVQGMESFTRMVAMQQIDAIEKHGCIYINKVGGYHSAYQGEPQYKFCYRNNLIFPDFKQDDIRIKQFPYGTHYYAYIGDTQVRDGDTLKWDTYEKAYNNALKYIAK